MKDIIDLINNNSLANDIFAFTFITLLIIFLAKGLGLRILMNKESRKKMFENFFK